ncbi:Mov34/MPN/PAD-1 family protein [Pectobacterium aroidearum]|uniref:Mov34/MPN/PAD-1 family protein n=1 Tax=Pectobacterium aroidearum TaxID=1201031 RepID=UPI003306F24A
MFAPDLNSELILRNQSGGLVIVETAALRALAKYRQLHKNQHEQGGVLIGEVRPPHLIITHITEPGPADVATRFGFIRKKQHHQETVDQLWLTSGGFLTYLGEWHTHPEPNPSPSGIDLSSWKKGLPHDRPSIVAIIGQQRDWWGHYDRGKCIRLVNEQTD